MAARVCLVSSLAALVVPAPLGTWLGWGVAGILVGVPIARVVGLTRLWWAAEDRGFAVLAAAVPLVIVMGAAFVAWR